MTDTKHRQWPNSPAPTKCPCIQCLSEVETFIWWMVVCDLCGWKRCPHSDDHRNPCSGSNELGQPGSRYPAHSPHDVWGNVGWTKGSS